MFKKILFRSLAGATAAGSALAISLVSTPAVVTSAPEVRHVACTVNYPSSVATSTNVSVRPAIGAYGTAARATATVSSGSGTPTGRVRFVLTHANGSVIDSWTVSLSQGSASVGLPRRLDAGHTYTVRGNYMPGCSRFKRSGDSAYYTVQKAPTSTSVNAPNVRRGDNARVRVAVSSRTVTPVGKVRIVIERRGNVIASMDRTLSDGRASATFGRYRVGYYTAKVVYFGTGNFARSSGSDDFRVRR